MFLAVNEQLVAEKKETCLQVGHIHICELFSHFTVPTVREPTILETSTNMISH